jgi:hypothetical protein
MSTARNILLLQLSAPGEVRGRSYQSEFAEESREYVTKRLSRFRDIYIKAGEENRYEWMHATTTIGGAIKYALGLPNYSTTFRVSGPTNPAAYIVLKGLSYSRIAQNIKEKELLDVKPEDFLKDKFEKDSVRMRPGWNFSGRMPIKISQA